MRKIKDIISKPSQAVRAMIDGLKEQSERKDFIVDMSTFGWHKLKGLCFGCAATCAVQKIGGKNFNADNISLASIRSEFLGIDYLDLTDFECAIDCLRKGYYTPLFRYFGIDPAIVTFSPLPVLDTSNWRNGLPAYERFAAYLESIGL